MPRRKRNPALTDFFDDAVDTFVDRAVDRAAGAFETIRSRAFEQQREDLSDEYLDGPFRCAACKREFGIDDMEQVHPNNGWGTCRGCYGFMFKAAVEKAKALGKKTARKAKEAASQRGQQRRQPFQAPPPPQGPPPWEVLGVSVDATIEQIKKAYRRKAALYHPDRVAPNAPSHELQNAKMMFQAVTRARDAMIKVRSAPT